MRLLINLIWIVLLTTSLAFAPLPNPQNQEDNLNPNPPDHVVRLVFVHHSTGENWLSDENGGLGIALGENNYFVSDTNYGWGPDSIGDRTDIPNWVEWFRGSNSDTILQALYNLNEQNAPYTRTLSEPGGGENEIIMFKSCFPNSDLSGSPDDSPTPGEDFTVGNAKYVYNEILKYFATRPDKLFVVITAPPLSDPNNAANARGFNEWLVNDWLAENNYPLNNVAVFDFYTILTGPDHHHRYVDGKIEHVYKKGANTGYYPSGGGDDHPSRKGNLKATEEFLPMLNIFYNRWRTSQPHGSVATEAPLVGSATEAPVDNTNPPDDPGGQPAAGMIDNFEGDDRGWNASWDEATTTTIQCGSQSASASEGQNALQIDFSVAAGSWGTCGIFFDTPQNWSSMPGPRFDLQANKSDLSFNVDIFTGQPDARETYTSAAQSNSKATNSWVPVSMTWTDFLGVEWEANAGKLFDRPNQVLGISFGFNAPEDAALTGTIWIDNLRLQGEVAETGQEEMEATAPVKEESGGNEPEPTEPPASRPGLPCSSAALLPLAVMGAWLWRRNQCL
jgi:hypothetical protein